MAPNPLHVLMQQPQLMQQFMATHQQLQQVRGSAYCACTTVSALCCSCRGEGQGHVQQLEGKGDMVA